MYHEPRKMLSSGDLVAALVPMRAWEDDSRRGEHGLRLDVGQQALIIDAWLVGKRLRMRVVYDERVIVFSCALRVVDRNWKVARKG